MSQGAELEAAHHEVHEFAPALEAMVATQGLDVLKEGLALHEPVEDELAGVVCAFIGNNE